jgi:hypothetical protein
VAVVGGNSPSEKTQATGRLHLVRQGIHVADDLIEVYGSRGRSIRLIHAE